MPLKSKFARALKSTTYTGVTTALQISDGTTGIDPMLPAILIACLSVTALFTALASTYASDYNVHPHRHRDLPHRMSMITPSFTVLVIGARSKALASASSAPFQVEIAPANARGALAAIEAFCINAGYAASAWAGYAFSASAQGSHTSRRPYAVQSFAALALVLCSFLLPESPHWLIQNRFTTEGL
ncbi:hypothetical protein DFH09DRAFT_1412561 [Mycena vulgaris]|nr:hypothetical protein DFH09DRAFT_1412561 [Mycena vulgaris]